MSRGPVFISHCSSLLWLGGVQSPSIHPTNQRVPNGCITWCSAREVRLRLSVRLYHGDESKSADPLFPLSPYSEGPGMHLSFRAVFALRSFAGGVSGKLPECQTRKILPRDQPVVLFLVAQRGRSPRRSLQPPG